MSPCGALDVLAMARTRESDEEEPLRLHDPKDEPPMYRRSHPYRALVIMTLPFLLLVAVVFIPFVGWGILFVLLPIEFGRLGGKRLARPDAVWVAVPAALAVGTYELIIAFAVLNSIPPGVASFDTLGLVATAVIYGTNIFFFCVGTLSTAFDPHEPVSRDGRESLSS
jgi:hypothetical protein